MATPAFRAFLDQFNSKGRLHGEGYDASHFRGLSDMERAQVEEMLLTAGLNGDSTAISGLILLGDEGAVDALKKIQECCGNGNTAGIQANAALLTIRRSSADLGELLNAIKLSDQLLSWIALVELPCDVPLNNEDRTAIAEELAKYIAGQEDMVRRNVAAKKLLRLLEIREYDSEYREYVRKLSDDSADTRNDALSKLTIRAQ